VLSSWAEWSSCHTESEVLQNCGQGIQERARTLIKMPDSNGVGCTNTGYKELTITRPCTMETSCEGAVDCVWGEWSDWSSVDQALVCGTGSRTRNRTVLTLSVHGGLPCDNRTQSEIAPCSEAENCTVSCPHTCIDETLSEWAEWSACSVTCGSGGVQDRQRSIATEANYCGRPLDATYHLREYQQCSNLMNMTCEDRIHCEFGAWTDWQGNCSDCSGVMLRTRVIAQNVSGGGAACNGNLAENGRCQGYSPHCHGGPQPQDCVLHEWTSWGECSKECGGGSMERSRSILIPPSNGGADCESALGEVQECNDIPCITGQSVPVDCQFANWEEWGQCDYTAGQRTRRRAVLTPKSNGGQDCTGLTRETELCTRDCVPTTHYCTWGNWASWSECSMTCGPAGRKQRMRQLQVTDTPPARRRLDELHPVQREKIDLHMQLALESSRRRQVLLAAFTGGFSVLFLALGALRLAGRRGGASPAVDEFAA